MLSLNFTFYQACGSSLFCEASSLGQITFFLLSLYLSYFFINGGLVFFFFTIIIFLGNMYDGARYDSNTPGFYALLEFI